MMNNPYFLEKMTEMNNRNLEKAARKAWMWPRSKKERSQAGEARLPAAAKQEGQSKGTGGLERAACSS